MHRLQASLVFARLFTTLLLEVRAAADGFEAFHLVEEGTQLMHVQLCIQALPGSAASWVYGSALCTWGHVVIVASHLFTVKTR